MIWFPHHFFALHYQALVQLSNQNTESKYSIDYRAILWYVHLTDTLWDGNQMFSILVEGSVGFFGLVFEDKQKFTSLSISESQDSTPHDF